MTWGQVSREAIALGPAAGGAYALSYLVSIATANYEQNGVLDPSHWFAALLGTNYYIGLPVMVVGVLLGIAAIAIPTMVFPVLRRLHGVLASALHAATFIIVPLLVLDYLASLAPAYAPIAAAVLLATFLAVGLVARWRIYPPAHDNGVGDITRQPVDLVRES